MVEFVCNKCGARFPIDTLQYVCECGGLYELDYIAPAFSPSLIDKTQFNIFRYRAFMPLEGDLWRDVTLGEGVTSCVPLDDELFLKLDYAMPTLSFKDRGAALLIWLCKSIGVKKVIQDSSGNAGNSVAAYAAKSGIECEIFVPKGTSPKKINMIKAHGASVTVFDGTRDETADACRKKAIDEKLYYANHVYNPLFYQGTKTYIYEVYEQLGAIPDNIFIPVGNGTLLLGAIIGLSELYVAQVIDKLPKIFGVQSEMCAPLYGAKDTPRQIQPKPTLAEGIAIGKPMRATDILHSSYHGEIEFILTKEDTILDAQAKLAHNGFYVEPTTAATYAAYLSYKAEHKLNGKSLIPLCGAGLKSEK